LVQKSLVLAEEEGGQARYRLLETVRQYAGEKLLDAGEGAAVRTRHRDVFLALAERAAPELDGRTSWPGSTGWRPGTATCARRWPGARPRTGARTPNCGWPGRSAASGPPAGTSPRGGRRSSTRWPAPPARRAGRGCGRWPSPGTWRASTGTSRGPGRCWRR